MGKVAVNSGHINILLVGGVGLWSEKNHIPNLAALKQRGYKVKLVAVCDIQDPAQHSDRKNLQKMMREDMSKWISVSNNNPTPLSQLDKLLETEPLDLVIIACNPVAHFGYAMWAVKNNLHVICDKPLLDVANSASDVNAARRIWSNYEKLVEAYLTAKKETPHLNFNLVLRRRSLPAFTLVADRLRYVAEQYGAGINHINILNHGGIYKYPEEMEGYGAHDFSSGVGSLSHSSYHYLDLFNWYLKSAKGPVKYIVPRLTNILRIGDYLDTEAYKHIKAVNTHTKSSMKKLPKEVLACELDVAFNILFYDKSMRPVGDANFIANHLSFSPRTRDFEAGITEPAQFVGGGRISHLYVDIHQSGLQNLQLIKNDVTFEGSNILVQTRTHPGIEALSSHETIYFDDAYRNTDYSMEEILRSVVDAILARQSVISTMIPSLLDDKANAQLFAKFYEIVALDYSEKQNNKSKVYKAQDLIELT